MNVERSGPTRFDEIGDATRRTHLANERTYLAWWRTGLTCLVVSIGAGKVVPDLSGQARWPYAILGAGFGLLGLAFIGYGLRRQREVGRAVSAGEFDHPDDRILAVLTAAGIVLGVLLVLLVLIET